MGATSEKIWRIRHRTSYTYSSPARQSFNDARLTPASNSSQTLKCFELLMEPEVPVHRYIDYCGNQVHHFEVSAPHDKLAVETRAVVAVHAAKALEPDAPSPPLHPASLEWPLECYDYLGPSRFVEIEPEIWRLAIDATADHSHLWPAVLGISRFVHRWLTYTPAATNVHTTAMQLLAQRQGVCQDYAHLMLAMCRSLKIPARYVSGYLATQNVRATHAWVEVYLPAAGWQPLDPTHNQTPNNNYIKIGAGRDYADVAPVTGYYKGTRDRTMEVEVEIAEADGVQV